MHAEQTVLKTILFTSVSKQIQGFVVQLCWVWFSGLMTGSVSDVSSADHVQCPAVRRRQ